MRAYRMRIRLTARPRHGHAMGHAPSPEGKFGVPCWCPLLNMREVPCGCPLCPLLPWFVSLRLAQIPFPGPYKKKEKREK